MIEKDLTRNTISMKRIGGRIMKIRLGANIRGVKISILNTYAPHMCYNTGGRGGLWAKVGAILKQ